MTETRIIKTIRTLALCGLCLAGSLARGQAPQAVFDSANMLYERQQYDSAARMYARLIDAGYRNAELYFNAGNAHYKGRHPGYAVYYYEKALQQSPGNEAIAHNLQLAHQQATDKLDQIPTLFFIRWWQQLLHVHSANGWLWGAVLLCWITLALVGWRLLRPPAPRWTRWGIAVFSLLCILYLCCATASWYRSTHHDYAIVVVSDEKMKAAPDADSPDVMLIHEGLKVQVLDEVGEWKKIRLTDGKTGWVKADSMLLL